MAAHLQFVPEEVKIWTDSQGRPIAIAEVTISVIMRMFLLKPTPATCAGCAGLGPKWLDLTRTTGAAYRLSDCKYAVLRND